MNRFSSILVLAALSSTPAYAQTYCGTPGVSLDVTPLVAAFGEPFQITMTNNTPDVVGLGNTCILDAVYPGTSCTGIPIFLPTFCGPVDLALPPGLSTATGWGQFDSSFQQVPSGTYTIQIFYNINGVFSSCCAVVTIEDFSETCAGDGGDQLGCTDCPCGNNAFAGTIGGCINSAGRSNRLVPSGSGSISAADLEFGASGLPLQAIAQLTSGDALAPANAANPCFGLDTGVNSLSFDGLRCVVQNLARHGTRVADFNGIIDGVTALNWDSGAGIPGLDAFVAGDTRYFQIVYRDDPASGCMTGSNTSQAVTVSFTP